MRSTNDYQSRTLVAPLRDVTTAEWKHACMVAMTDLRSVGPTDLERGVPAPPPPPVRYRAEERDHTTHEPLPKPELEIGPQWLTPPTSREDAIARRAIGVLADGPALMLPESLDGWIDALRSVSDSYGGLPGDPDFDLDALIQAT